MAERYSLLPVITGNPYPQNTARHAAYEAGRASLAANVITEGITRYDTVHGETYFTAADMATAAEEGYRDGAAETAKLRGQRMVLCSLLRECLPVIDALMQIPGAAYIDAHLNGLAGRIMTALDAIAEERAQEGKA